MSSENSIKEALYKQDKYELHYNFHGTVVNLPNENNNVNYFK